ncbi:MAG: hypothetical protein ACYTG6_14020, partial [Planctomycetota bacterium]
MSREERIIGACALALLATAVPWIVQRDDGFSPPGPIPGTYRAVAPPHTVDLVLSSDHSFTLELSTMREIERGIFAPGSEEVVASRHGGWSASERGAVELFFQTEVDVARFSSGLIRLQPRGEQFVLRGEDLLPQLGPGLL